MPIPESPADPLAPADDDHRRERQFEVLSEISRLATLDLELRPMLHRVSVALHRAFAWEFVSCVSVDNERGVFVCDAVATNLPTQVHVGYSRPLGSGVVGEVALTGRSIVLDDVRQHPTYIETMAGVTSELCVPVVHAGKLLAVLNLESTRIGAFHGQLALLETVARQVAGAIAGARLLEALSRHAEAIQAMNEQLLQTQELLEERSRALELANAQLVCVNIELERLASVDALTGAGNRRRLDEVLDVEWRRAFRSRNVLALLMVDVDGFKSYNDTFGHQQGDVALRAISDALRAGASRAGEFVGRYGGEEFVVVIPAISEDSPMECAELLRQRVADLAIAHPGSPLGVVTVSIGVGSCVPSTGSADMLLEAADAALYRAKADGRNCVRR